MNFIFMGVLTALLLFLGMILCMDIGWRIGLRQAAKDPESVGRGVGAVEGAVFGLMGLVIAFTFSGAVSRFDTRRALITEEANDIGTAWLRLDLLPAGSQPAVRENFRQYVDSRLAVYRELPDIAAANAELARGAVLQNQIWAQAVAGCREGPPYAAVLLLPALNQMFDVTTSRKMAALYHSPVAIYITLGVLMLAGSLVAGHGMAGGKNRNWIHILGLAVVMTATACVILDLEFPRLGLIRINQYDQVMKDTRQSMK